jgi:hypothetical protein
MPWRRPDMVWFKRLTQSWWSGRERRQQIAIVAVFGALLGLSVLLVHKVGSSKAPAPQRDARPEEQARNGTHARDDGETYTGSILYMPHVGATCHQLLFDNLTGKMADNGPVDCNRASYRPARVPPKNWSAARVDVIRDSFRDH